MSGLRGVYRFWIDKHPSFQIISSFTRNIESYHVTTFLDVEQRREVRTQGKLKAKEQRLARVQWAVSGR
ncbi:hypothetical protein BRADI_2g33266v3 [Brachypodium distachyon]|uniref:Uncharacterized protein n=1 Tax=Brachypodium distachyon TaxID=15368 RepID=A0A2K2DBJ6_BRADI|nr:hypothetical protein BRADI_2g33266v3 [Brachypodium distachyon]